MDAIPLDENAKGTEGPTEWLVRVRPLTDDLHPDDLGEVVPVGAEEAHYGFMVDAGDDPTVDRSRDAVEHAVLDRFHERFAIRVLDDFSILAAPASEFGTVEVEGVDTVRLRPSRTAPSP